MTATRDQEVWQYAIDLGYVDCGVLSGGHRLFRHTKTGQDVVITMSATDYKGLRNAKAQLRDGAGLSNRGRQAVVNGRKAKRPKKGANAARLEVERITRQRQELATQAEARHREEERERERITDIENRAVRQRIPAAVLKRMAEIRQYEGLMRGA